MAKRLNTYVHAVERNDKGEIVQSDQFGPDDDLPDWARKAITNPNVWEGADEDDDKSPEPASRGRRGGRANDDQ